MLSWCHKVVVTKFTWTEQAAKMHYMFSSQNPNIWKVQKNAYLIRHRKTCEYWGLALCQATEQQLNGEKLNLVYYLLVVTFFLAFYAFGFCFRVLAVILDSVFLLLFFFFFFRSHKLITKLLGCRQELER